jgi:hypothetical protein
MLESGVELGFRERRSRDEAGGVVGGISTTSGSGAPAADAE